MEKKRSVLFICLGNICRSPMAEAVFVHLLEQRGIANHWTVDSAALIDYHVGKRPDKRTLDTLRTRGITGYEHRVRQITLDDFSEFDFILGMDNSNIAQLNSLAKSASKKSMKASIELLGSYDPDGDMIIPDPYYETGLTMFNQVFDQCLRSCTGFLDKHSH